MMLFGFISFKGISLQTVLSFIQVVEVDGYAVMKSDYDKLTWQETLLVTGALLSLVVAVMVLSHSIF